MDFQVTEVNYFKLIWMNTFKAHFEHILKLNYGQMAKQLDYNFILI